MKTSKTPRPAVKAVGRTAGRFIAELVDCLEGRHAELEASLDQMAEDLDDALQRINELESLSSTNENRLDELGDIETELSDLRNELSEIGQDES